MMSLLVIVLVGGSGVSGADLTPKQKLKASPQRPTTLEEAPEPQANKTGAILGQAPNLTPKTVPLAPPPPQDFGIVHIAQNSAAPSPAPQPSPVAPVPQPPQAVVVTDPSVYAELDRLSAEIKALKKDIPKKPDTKKAWSSPKVSGRIFLDSVNVMGQNDNADNVYGNGLQNSMGFREIRLGVSGNGYDSFDYKIEVGFVGKNGTVDLIDNWVGAKNVPLLGYVRAGHFKPETGLYYPMGTNDISLMEYTTSANVFGLGRRVGISSENTFADDRVRAFFGVFHNGATNQARYLKEDNQGQVVNLRLSAAPLFAQEGRHVLHIGGHWEYAGTESSKTASINASPGTLALLDYSTLRSGTFACDHFNRGGLEFAYQHGPFSVRSEAFAGSYDAYKNSPSRNLFGAYVEVGWFLTGEHRVYNLNKGGFGAVKVKRNFHPFKSGDCNLIDGWGAWQAVAQWSYTDLSDWRNNSAMAGYQNDLVLGMSWFWTPQLRWVFEYVHSMQNVGPAGYHVNPTEDLFGMSVRVHF